MVPTYVFIARKLLQIENLNKMLSNNPIDEVTSVVNDRVDKCYSEIEKCIKSYFPYGSGFDSGTELVFDISTPEKLCFKTSFHHMNENGYYDGWTDHTVIVKSSLVFGFDFKITGKNRNDIKEYITDCFNNSLEFLVDEYSGEHTGV